MRFCPKCNNILIPRNKKLYCKACDEEFDFENKSEDYKIVKTIKHDEKESAPIIIKEVVKTDRISDRERKAFEEYFDLSEADGY
ncbi:MAG: hypothetical protein ACTSRH_06925 [Promethearchaeota archaeon]